MAAGVSARAPDPPRAAPFTFEGGARLASLEEILDARRSVRRFARTPVSDELIGRLLALADTAPSAHNTRPWRFVVVRTPAARQRLVEGLANAYTRYLRRLESDPGTVRRKVGAAQRLLGAAPVAVVICLDLGALEGERRRRRAEHLLGMQSVACAATTLLLAATAAGLGSCWVSAPLFAGPATNRALDIPKDWRPQLLILLGYGLDVPGPRDRPGPVTLWR